MALDNAEFISELSILDPPGTDPLNQGDDHIRTTKKAVQQSFPNVGSAVPQTGVQMAQMAIKNEVNVFTQQQTFQQKLNAADGDAVNPSYNFTSRDAGMYASAGDRINWATAGVQRAFVDVSQFQIKVIITATDGSTAFPGYTFASETNTGMYRDTAGRLSFGVGGALKFLMEAGRIQSQVQHRFADSVALTPAISFASDPATGIYLEAVNTMGFSLGGIRQARVFSNSWQFFQQVLAPVLANATPAFSFTGAGGTGINYNGTNSVDAVVAGVLIFAMSSNGMFAGDGFQISGSGTLTAATKPGFAFGNDGDTGFYRAAANSASVAVGGVTAFNFDFASLAMWAGSGFAIRGDPSRVANQPAFAFTNDTDTGFYRVQANISGIAGAGQSIMTFGTGGVGIVAGVPFFPSLPTSPGIGGSLWNNGGVVNVA